tara:strand:+ start:187 stop:483 length:297 start_codon:yes stop_codon:yes gene_type:complete
MKILNINIFNKELAIKWDDESESYIKFKKLREECPCAHCSGETDVLGNKYIGQPSQLNEDSFIIKKIFNVGQYGIKVLWGDNHDFGIYTFEYLKSLSD